MKIGESRPVAGAAGVRVRPKTGGATSAASSNGAQETGDVTSIMGIPEAELTPKVRVAIQNLMQEVARLRQELDQTRGRIGYLEQLADQDSLVPVVNRRAFVRELSRMMSFSERYGSPGSILFFDLNKMKAINDTHGHAAGDAALSHLANVLLENVRESDVVGRLGGDEFGVILAQADEASAAEKAALLASAVQGKPLVWEQHQIVLSVSYGAYSFRGSEDAGDALHAADRAMYQHKRQAGGRS